MSDRGMKKWAPYKSLNEQEFYLNKMREEKSKVEKPIISQDKAEEIDYILHNHQGHVLVFEYFYRGHILKIEQTIIEIDIVNRIVRGSEENLHLDNIVGLSEK